MHAAFTSLMHYSCMENNVNSSIFSPQGNTFKLQTLSLSYSDKVLPVCLYFWCGQFAKLMCNRQIFFNINKFPGCYTKRPEPWQVSSSVLSYLHAVIPSLALVRLQNCP